MLQLTNQQIKKQDFVDNQIFELLQRISPSIKIQWDIEMIGNIRDLIQIELIDKKLINKTGFYP